MCSIDDAKVSFYQTLNGIIRNIPQTDNVIALGDFNPRVCRDFNAWTVIGKYVIGKCNSHGMLLLQKSKELCRCVTNNTFQQKFKSIWMQLKSSLFWISLLLGCVTDEIFCMYMFFVWLNVGLSTAWYVQN